MNLTPDLKKIPKSVFWILINPALVMGLGLVGVNVSKHSLTLADWTDIDFFSMFGHLTEEKIMAFSGEFHGALNDLNLIPVLVFGGILVFIFRHYRELSSKLGRRKRFENACSMATFESLIVLCALFAATITNIVVLFDDATTNFGGIWIIVAAPVMAINLRRKWFIKKFFEYIDSKSLNRN